METIRCLYLHRRYLPRMRSCWLHMQTAHHCWPTTPNIVRFYMLRRFAHPVACCWVVLGVDAQSLNPVKRANNVWTTGRRCVTLMYQACFSLHLQNKKEKGPPDRRLNESLMQDRSGVDNVLECVQGVRMGKRKGNFGRAIYNSSFWGCRAWRC